VTIATTDRTKRKAGLAFWMERVLEECDRASVDFAAVPVHDLRVALRRCRSMADGIMAVDPDPALKEMKKAGKRLFSRLGDLRDVQVMEGWVHHFDSPGDPVTSKLLEHLATRETQLKQEAAQALLEFDRKQWRKWSRSLPHRTARLRPGNAVFKHLALERWIEAYELHRRALRNRSRVAFHSLRIGLKRFRYIVENFLPEQHATWGADLKQLQDWLGEVHDLDVLWSTTQQVAFLDDDSRSRWHTRILEERERRVQKYRETMLGPASLWRVWRKELPQGREIEAGALRRLRLWASFLDPDFKHANHVARLALQLYDGLAKNGPPSRPPAPREREILYLAALLHEVGQSEGEKGHHKSTYRLIRRLTPPVGVSEPALHLAGIVARYHRGALPRAGQTAVGRLSVAEKQEVLHVAGILRLANALDSARDGRIQRVEVQSRDGHVVVAAQGYSARDRMAEDIAGGRHLLEVVYRRPVMVKPLVKRARRLGQPSSGHRSSGQRM
jgi:CHAD domain-containing protein